MGVGHQTAPNMKMLIFLALTACAVADPKAEAEADPFYYGGVGYVYPSYGYGHVIYGKRDAEAEAKPFYYGGVGYGYPSYGYVKREAYGHVVKREAEAEAGRYYYGAPYGYVKREAEAEAEAGRGYYGGYGHVVLGKRDAEAEARPFYYG